MLVKIKFSAEAEGGEDPHSHAAKYTGRMPKAKMQEIQALIMTSLVEKGNDDASK